MKNMILNINDMQEAEYVINAAYAYHLKTAAEATAEWRSVHHKGKFVICESRKGYTDGRMFIRIVTHTSSEQIKKKGWWDTFTISEFPVSTGLWLCKVKKYRVDSNGYLNMIVEPVTEIPELKHGMLFQDKNGTWNSPAINLMFGGGRFLWEYDFLQTQELNLTELRKRFPRYAKQNTVNRLRDAVLYDWLRGDITLEEIESALNEPSDYKKFIKRIQTSVANHTTREDFPNHPIFAEKIALSDNSASRLFGKGFIGYREVQEYVERNVRSYNELVREQKLTPIDSDDLLDKIEAVLAYRKRMKDLEKQAKKAARKKKAAF